MLCSLDGVNTTRVRFSPHTSAAAICNLKLLPGAEKAAERRRRIGYICRLHILKAAEIYGMALSYMCVCIGKGWKFVFGLSWLGKSGILPRERLIKNLSLLVNDLRRRNDEK